MNILFGIVAVLIVVVVLYYNKFVTIAHRAEEAWSDIDVQLKRRYDLIPNLVNAVKGYASHEQDTFDKVTQARAEAMKASTTGEHALKEANLSAMIGNLMAVAEAYPELKANENFSQLQTELSDTENKIQASRRFYNNQVLTFNNKLEVFPTNIIGGMFGFKVEEFFNIENDKERENVEVKF